MESRTVNVNSVSLTQTGEVEIENVKDNHAYYDYGKSYSIST